MAGNNTSFRLLLATDGRLLNVCLLLLRCTAGVILFVVGAGKALGWFGGRGMETTLQNFAERGFAPFLVYLSCYTEFIGGLLLAIGLFARPAALAIAINMLVATIVSMPSGFFFGRAAYPFTIMVIAIVVLLAGPMAYSIDSMMSRSGEVMQEMPEQADPEIPPSQ